MSICRKALEEATVKLFCKSDSLQLYFSRIITLVYHQSDFMLPIMAYVKMGVAETRMLR